MTLINTFGPLNAQAAFLPPEQDFPEDDNLFREILTNRERMTATILNVKETAQYEKVEILSGQQYFSAVSGGTSVTGGAIKTNYGFRLTFDLVSLNGAPIPNGGVTIIPLPTDPAINTPTTIQYANGLIPLHGFGAATAGTTYYFINDPNLYVRFVNTSTVVQTINITNTTGFAITQCYWVFEYLKT